MSNLNNIDNLSTEEKVDSLVDNVKELLSNVKWLYKYGGSGSGGSSGGGSSSTSTSFLILVYVGDITYKCIASESTSISIYPTINKSYQLPIRVLYMNKEHTYIFKYYLNGSTNANTIDLNDTNEGFISLTGEDTGANGSFIIRGLDTTDGETTVNINVTYIVEPIEVSTSLVGTLGTEPDKYNISSGEILMGDYSNVYTRFTFTFYNTGTVTYKYKKIGSEEFTTIEKNSTDYELGKENSEDLLILDSTFLADETNLGTYSTEAECYYIPTGESPILLELDDSSISLIPSSLYVEITPDSGTIYKEDATIPREPYTYLAGTRSFSIRIYNGRPDNEHFSNLTLNIYDLNRNLIKTSDILINSIGERDKITYTGYISCASEEAQEYSILLVFGDPKQVIQTKTYYMFIKKSELDYNWIDSSISYSDQYFNREGSSNIFTDYTDTIKCTRSASAISLTLSWTGATESTEEFMFSFGLQYSEVNPSTVKLISIQDSNNALSNYIDIYQDSINIEGNTVDIYIPKEAYETYNTVDGQYHMLLIYRRATGKAGTTAYYEWVIYIDGVIENVLPSFLSTAVTYNTILLNPTVATSGNFIINHIGILKFPVGNYILGYTARDYHGLHDVGVMLYYFKYDDTTTLVLSDTNALILKDIKSFKYTYNETTHNMEPYITVTGTMLNNIVRNSGIPTLVVQIDNANKQALLDDILDTSWGEEDSFDFDCTTLKYRSAGTDASFNEFTSNTFSDKTERTKVVFNIAMLGSSTKGYPVKNFEISIKKNDDTVNVVPVYSLDYGSEDGFYPETSFTFKADQVDSSHCDNTSCGEIINNYMTPYNAGVKNCLTGKPLLFVLQTDTDGDAYQILGIYNYNLGRNSKFNLGHAVKDTSIITTGFIVEGLSNDSYKDNFAVAEILNNSSYWDFSQYDDSILFLGECYLNSTDSDTMNTKNYSLDLLDKYDTMYMWGDIKYNTAKHRTDVDFKNSLRNLMKSISEAGGAIFKSIGKEFSSTMYQSDSKTKNTVYRVINTVPDCLVQHHRYLIDNTTEWYYGYNDYSITTDLTDTESLLKTCIYDDSDTGRECYLNFTSALEYYVMCMGLGLVDSVLKNLNIKTWDFVKWYVAFYDMDTSFGIDNAGAYISPFAFSDYWSSGTSGAVTIYRDYWDPDDTTNTGFDIPSSYLFAIAKYAEFVRSNSSGLTSDDYMLSTPSIEWAKLRGENGMFRNAKYVVDTYFISKVKSINAFIWNINYRYKYLQLQYTGTNIATSYDSSILKFFHGKRWYYTQDWLKKRFHVLDAYFNVNNLASTLNGNITDSVANSSRLDSSINNNEDVLIKRSIFGSGTQGIKTSNDISSTIKVNEFSPFIIVNTKLPNGVKFLFNEPDTEYTFDVNVNGNQNTNFYGSGSWSYLDSLNCYISSAQSLEIHSDLLENLEADINSITPPGWIFYTPSLLSLKLTGNTFAGSLLVYYGDNIKSIDLSGTAISITDPVAASKLNTFSSLTALNLISSKATTMSIVNATKLSDIKLTGASIGTLLINPIIDSVSISGTHITNMTINGSTDKDNLTFSLNNDDTITTLSLSNFESITITNCPKLKTVILDNKVKYLKINSCGGSISGYITSGNTNNVLDLTNCTSLLTLNLLSMSSLLTLKLPALIITLNTNAFYNDGNLVSISGTVYINTATTLFYNCHNLNISNSDLKLVFDSSITSLASMFEMQNKGVITNNDIAKIYTALSDARILSSITNCSKVFYNNNITSVSSFLKTTSTFENCSNFSYAFARNEISEVITSSILNIGANVETLNINGIFESNSHVESSWWTPAGAIIRLEYNCLTNIGSKLTTFSMPNVGICAYDGSSALSTVLVYKFLRYCTKLTTISGMTFITSSKGAPIIDMNPDTSTDTPIYAIPSTVTSIDSFMTYVPFTIKGGDIAFANLSNLTNFSESLHEYMYTEKSITVMDDDGNTVDDDGLKLRINIWTMFDWENIANKLTGVFTTSDSNLDACTFPKKIEYKYFIRLLELIISSSTIKNVYSLFYNCKILEYSTSSNYANGVLKIPITDNMTCTYSNNKLNTKITALCRTFSYLSCENASDYIDFEESIFLKLYNCTFYRTVWNHCRLYRLYTNWFLKNTSAPISYLEGCFSSTLFMIPYDKEKSAKEYYYTAISDYWTNNASDTKKGTYNSISNRRIPDDWDGNYIISPTFFNNISSSATLSSLFADTNLFGLLPETLFSYLKSTNVKVTYMFDDTLIVPYKQTTLYLIDYDEDNNKYIPYIINVYCYVPDGTSLTKPYIYSSNANTEGTFNTMLIIPNSSDDQYKIKYADVQAFVEGVTEFPYTLEEGTTFTYYANTELDDNEDYLTDPSLFVNINYINFTYIYNLNSVTWSGVYNKFLPNSLYSELAVSQTCNFLMTELLDPAYRIYINAKYGGGTDMLNMKNNDDGLPLGSSSRILASGLIRNNLVSLYYGPIFKNSIDTSSIVLTNSTNFTATVINDWYRSYSNTGNYANTRLYILSRNLYFPKAYSTVSNFAIVHYDNDDKTYSNPYKLVANSGLFNSNATKTFYTCIETT